MELHRLLYLRAGCRGRGLAQVERWHAERQRHGGAHADVPAMGTGAGPGTIKTPRAGASGRFAECTRKNPGTRRPRGCGTMPQAAMSISQASGGGAGGRLSLAAPSGLGSRKLMEPRGPTTMSVV